MISIENKNFVKQFILHKKYCIYSDEIYKNLKSINKQNNLRRFI